MEKTTKETLQHSGMNGKIASLSILCHIKYSMKEYTIKYIYFNMYYVIQNFYKQMNTTKTKIAADVLH